MLIDVNPPVRLSEGVYRFTWEGSGQFFVWYQGRLVDVVDRLFYDVYEERPTVVPSIEVATEAEDVPRQLTHPTYGNLQWFEPADSQALGFHVVRVVGDDDVLLDVVPASAGAYRRYNTGVLPHHTEAAYRVRGELPGGVMQAHLPASVFIASMPENPRVALEYDPYTGQAVFQWQ